MSKTMVLITISSLLLAGAGVAVDGGENKSASAGAVKSRTFNVLNYGAVGDDGGRSGTRRGGHWGIAHVIVHDDSTTLMCSQSP